MNVIPVVSVSLMFCAICSSAVSMIWRSLHQNLHCVPGDEAKFLIPLKIQEYFFHSIWYKHFLLITLAKCLKHFTRPLVLHCAVVNLIMIESNSRIQAWKIYWGAGMSVSCLCIHHSSGTLSIITSSRRSRRLFWLLRWRFLTNHSSFSMTWSLRE